MLLPIVVRGDASGKATGILGVQWVGATGANAVVFVDNRGLPTKAVIGDFILLYSNWNTTAERVDIAKIYAPGSYVEVFKGVSATASVALATLATHSLAQRSSSLLRIESGSLTLQATCFPGCDSVQKNVAELLKIGGLAIEVGLCGAGAAVSLGAALLPCTGAIVGTAAMTVGDEKWLQDDESLYWGLKAAGCGAGLENPLEGWWPCASAALDFAGEVFGVESKVDQNNAPLESIAMTALGSLSGPSGVVSPGSGLPACPSSYECTPGAYMPCYPNGVKECSADCAWGVCSTGGSALCGGTTQCGPGSYCNAIGECVQQPPGGCAALCGTTCCSPTQACEQGSCVNASSDGGSSPDGSSPSEDGATAEPSPGSYTGTCTATTSPITCCSSDGTCSTTPSTTSSSSQTFNEPAGMSLTQLSATACPAITAGLSSGCGGVSCSIQNSTANTFTLVDSCTVMTSSASGCTDTTISETCTFVLQ
jgi:hypothetical protein